MIDRSRDVQDIEVDRVIRARMCMKALTTSRLWSCQSRKFNTDATPYVDWIAFVNAQLYKLLYSAQSAPSQNQKIGQLCQQGTMPWEDSLRKNVQQLIERFNSNVFAQSSTFARLAKMSWRWLVGVHYANRSHHPNAQTVISSRQRHRIKKASRYSWSVISMWFS
jgi:hypothetical protein